MNNTFNMLLWNARSLITPERRAMITKLPAHVSMVAVTETWYPVSPAPTITRIDTFPNNVNRPHRHHKGGVSIYARHHHSLNERQDLYYKYKDILVVEVHLPNSNITLLVCVVYRRSNNKSSHRLYRNLTRIIQYNNIHRKMPLVILGDMNAHHSEWSNRSENEGLKLKGFCDEHQLTVINSMYPSSHHQATHQLGGVIDLAITSHPQLFSSCTVYNDVSSEIQLISDHYPVMVTIPINAYQQLNHIPQPKWNMPKADWKMYQEICTKLAPNLIELIDSINEIRYHCTKQERIEELWRNMKQMIHSAAEEAIPLLPVNANKKKHWWYENNQLDQLLKQYHNALHHHKRHPDDPTAKPQLKSAKKVWKAAVKSAKTQSWFRFIKKCEDHDGRMQWKLLNRSFGTTGRANLSNIRNKQNELPRTKIDAVNNIAAHFAEVNSLPADMHYDAKHHDIVNEYVTGIDPHENHQRMDIPFLAEDVESVFKIIKLNAMGSDMISPYFLKYAPAALIVAFTKLFNYSWTNHVLPLEWKQANVCVLLKKGAPVDDIGSYRPISLTSVVVKSLERLILSRIMMHVKDKIINTQAGFRPRHCCTDQIYQLLSAINAYHGTMSRDSTKPFYAAFIDFSKAFDRVWTNGLLMKVHKMGICGHAYHWIRSFLTNRSLRVISGDISSDWYDISAGVPQGSVLSPLLFVIFINDLAESIYNATGGGSTCLKFADDVVIYHALHTRHNIQYCIEAALKWCFTWKMVINSNKSNIVPFTTGNRKWFLHDEFQPLIINQQYDTVINPAPLPPLTFQFVPTYKYLGITLNHHIQIWTPHVTNVLKKANTASALICRLIHRRGTQAPGMTTVRLLTRMMVYTTIGYGLPLWKMTKNQLHRLQSIIVRPLRMVLGLPRTTHYASILVEVGLPNLKSYIMMNTLMFYRRIRQLPQQHTIHNALQYEGWIFNARNKPIINKKAIISSSLLNTRKYHQWMDDGKQQPITIDIMKNCDKKFLSSRAILKSAINRSFNTCIKMHKSKHLQELWMKTNDPRHKMSSYLMYDDIPTCRYRARMRFDRTILRDALERHGGLRNGITNHCPKCGADGDTLIHYLFHCTDHDMMNARQTCINNNELYFPAITSDVKPITDYNNAIVICSDGSNIEKKNDGRHSGAAAMIAFPPIQPAPDRIDKLKIGINLNIIEENDIKWDVKNDNYWHHASFHMHGGTNNIAELVAADLGLSQVAKVIDEHPDMDHWHRAPIIIMSDSTYVIGLMSRGWKAKKNLAIVDSLLKRIQIISYHGTRTVYFQKVKAHSTHEGNNHADKLAKNAAHGRPTLNRRTMLGSNYVPHYVCNPLDTLINDYGKDYILGGHCIGYGKLSIKRMLEGTSKFIKSLINIRFI